MLQSFYKAKEFEAPRIYRSKEKIGTKTRKRASPDSSDGKESACNVGDPGSISGLERSPGEGNVNPLQYSCLENSMVRGAWQATYACIHYLFSYLIQDYTMEHYSAIKKNTFESVLMRWMKLEPIIQS